MNDRRRTWSYAAAGASFVLGLLLVFGGTAGGWVFVILGIVYLGLLTGGGQRWAAANPKLVRWGLWGLTVLLILLLILVEVLLARK